MNLLNKIIKITIICQTLILLVACQTMPLTAKTDFDLELFRLDKPEAVDLGFRANPNGFKFANGSAKPYKANIPGSEFLTVKGMQLMFGDESVCGGQTSGDNCKPTLAAKKWQEDINLKMNTGQCEGLAVLALSMFKGHDQPILLAAGKNSAFELDYGSSVREAVGRYYAYQFTENVVKSVVKGTPTEVLTQLSAHLKFKPNDPVTLGFFGDTGGHSTIPYAIEDKGKGVYQIKMYDNNWPDQERFLEVDTQADTWIYNYASRNPSEPVQAWTGDAKTKSLEFTPLSSRLQKAECPFCGH